MNSLQLLKARNSVAPKTSSTHPPVKDTDQCSAMPIVLRHLSSIHQEGYVLTVDKVCLDLASSTRGRILAAFTAACLQTHLASRQEKRVVIIINNK